ncbi:MAG: RDD family protein [Pseudomonadota bacterium]
MQEPNPYDAPSARIEASAPQERLEIDAAGRWRRFFNWAIDYACFTLVAILVTIPYAVWLVLQGDEAALARLEQPNLLRDYGIGMLAMLLYYIPMEGLFGFTVGKLVTGTRVVNEQGGRPSLGQVVGRTFARFIPFEPFSILLPSDSACRGWHDSLARTWVVRKRR